MISRNNLSEGDIVDAFVYFEDNPTEGKRRPVLILSPEEAFALSLKMTSHPPRIGYPGEYNIIKWKEAGLSKPTTVRISKILRIRYEDIIIKRGRINESEMFRIRQLFSQIHRIGI